MGVRDITPDSVHAAISEGCDTVDLLAERFGVLHVSHTLRSTIHELAQAGRVERFPVPGSPSFRFETI